MSERIAKIFLLLLLLSLPVSCGHGDTGSTSSTSDGELTSTRIDSISRAMNSAGKGMVDAISQRVKADSGANGGGSFNISMEASCPNDGVVAGSGDITLSYDAQTSKMAADGQLTLDVSDPSAAANDCLCTDTVLDGTLDATVSGEDPNYQVIISGTISVSIVDASSGMRLLVTDSCDIQLTYKSGSSTGTICDETL